MAFTLPYSRVPNQQNYWKLWPFVFNQWIPANKRMPITYTKLSTYVSTQETNEATRIIIFKKIDGLSDIRSPVCRNTAEIKNTSTVLLIWYGTIRYRHGMVMAYTLFHTYVRSISVYFLIFSKYVRTFYLQQQLCSVPSDLWTGTNVADVL